MPEVEYIVSTFPSNSEGYQAKKGDKGQIKAYISNIYRFVEKENEEDRFGFFVDLLNYVIIHERFCLERAFQKIKIKGGMCDPCCIMHLAENACQYLFDIQFEDGVVE